MKKIWQNGKFLLSLHFLSYEKTIVKNCNIITNIVLVILHFDIIVKLPAYFKPITDRSYILILGTKDEQNLNIKNMLKTASI